MRDLKKWSLLLRFAEILVLIAAIILVVRWIPDFGYSPTDDSTSLESMLGDETEPETGETSTALGTDFSSAGEDSKDGMEGTKRHSGVKPKHTESYLQDESPPQETEAIYKPPVIAVASDLHYMSPTMTDFGEVLSKYTEGSDGKVIPYLDQITDAFLDEIVEQKPSVLILSGDISQDGEKVNHGELARKLRKVQSLGVPVLVIPGNHDINNPWASTYYGENMVPTETVDADGFYDIYHEFGYDQAAGRDADSLSYLYKLDERYWIMMLDSCVYFPENEVGGRIKRSTLTWMEEWLNKAEEEQVTIIPVAHHNLLNESVLYPKDCTLKNNREVIQLLERYGVPVYISGHLHLQRIKKNINSPSAEEGYGIHEIVSNSLSIPPCQYGILSLSEDGSLNYRTKVVDVASWAVKKGSTDDNLLNFAEYSRDFLVDVISSQTYRSLDSIPDDRKNEMARLYGALNSAYCAGIRINTSEIKASETYFYWERYLGSSKWFDRLLAILKDTKNEHNSLVLKAGLDFPVKNKTEVRQEETNQIEADNIEAHNNVRQE